MRNIAFINLIEISEVCGSFTLGGKTVADRIQEYANSLTDIDLIIPVALDIEQADLFFKGEKPGKVLVLEENRIDLLVREMSREAEGFDHCLYFYGDTPLLDTKLTKKMIDNHYRYYAHYSFADGYPYGLTPEILSSSCLKQLIPLAEKESGQVKRDSLFHCLQKDINAFDIETEISPVDMRLKRISLSCDSKRNQIQLENIFLAGGKDAESITGMDDRIEQYCRTLPVYFQIQLAEQCFQSCSYCPYPESNPDHLKKGREIPLEQILDLAVRIEEFSPDSVLSLSLWGDPVSHRSLGDVLEGILKKTNLKILIETAGLGWGNYLENHQSCLDSNRIDWIFSLDALSPEMYRILRGEGQQEALATVEAFLKRNPSHTWVQAVRMVENEEDLEQFFRYWKEKTENVIIQKYDYFCGHREQKKVTDLSPLNRFPCWHLKREMAILADGTALLCREDLKKETALGNVFKQSLQEIWEAANPVFQSHLNADYPGICENCDEFYTYNF